MRIRKLLSLCLLFFVSWAIAVGCNPTTDSNTATTPENPPIVLGYSSWPGWWPWYIAEKEGLFEANGANVKLQWFDGYIESMEALAAGQIDANCQTLNDTISFAARGGEW